MIETPNPLALITCNLADPPSVFSGSEALATTPIVRNGVGSYTLTLAEPLPFTVSFEGCAIFATVNYTADTTPEGRIVQAYTTALNPDQVQLRLRSAVTGALADAATVAVSIYRQPTRT